MNKSGIIWGFLGFSLGIGYYQFYQNNMHNFYKPAIKPTLVKKEQLNYEFIRNYNYFSFNLNNESRNIYIIESFNSAFLKDFFESKTSHINARINYIPYFKLNDSDLIRNIFCLSSNPGMEMFKYVKESSESSLLANKYCNFSKVLIFNTKLINLNIESKLPIIYFDSGDVVYNLKNSDYNLFNQVLSVTSPKYSYTPPIFKNVYESKISFQKPVVRPKEKELTSLISNFKQFFKNFRNNFKKINVNYYYIPKEQVIHHNVEKNLILSSINYKTNNLEIKFWDDVHRASYNWFPVYQFKLKEETNEQTLPNENNYPNSQVDDVKIMKVPPLIIKNNYNKNSKINHHQQPISLDKRSGVIIKTYAPPKIIKVAVPKFATEGLNLSKK